MTSPVVIPDYVTAIIQFFSNNAFWIVVGFIAFVIIAGAIAKYGSKLKGYKLV